MLLGITCGSTNLDQGFKTQLMKDIERDIRPGFDLHSSSLRNKVDLATFEWGKDHKKSINRDRIVDLWVPFKFSEARTTDLAKFGEDDDGDLGYYCITKYVKSFLPKPFPSAYLISQERNHIDI